MNFIFLGGITYDGCRSIEISFTQKYIIYTYDNARLSLSLLSRVSGVSFFPVPSGVPRHQKTEKVGTLRKYPRNKMG